MYSTCLPCPGYLCNCVVVQRLRSRLHPITGNLFQSLTIAWTVSKTRKTLFLFNRVAKLLLDNTTKEEIQQSKQSEKCLLWSFRSCSCGIGGPPDTQSCSRLLSALGDTSLMAAGTYHRHTLLHSCMCTSNSFMELPGEQKHSQKHCIWTKNFKKW